MKEPVLKGVIMERYLKLLPRASTAGMSCTYVCAHTCAHACTHTECRVSVAAFLNHYTSTAFLIIQSGHCICGQMSFSNASHTLIQAAESICAALVSVSLHPLFSTPPCARSLCCKQWPLCFKSGTGKHAHTWETACFMP